MKLIAPILALTLSALVLAKSSPTQPKPAPVKARAQMVVSASLSNSEFKDLCSASSGSYRSSNGDAFCTLPTKDVNSFLVSYGLSSCGTCMPTSPTCIVEFGGSCPSSRR